MSAWANAHPILFTILAFPVVVVGIALVAAVVTALLGIQIQLSRGDK